MAIFIFLGMGAVCRTCGFRITKLVGFIREEIILVFGTSSSESALPGLMRKLAAWGCDKAVVGLVVPTGYSFNLDGTALYLSMALLFMAQAYDVALSWHQQAVVFGVLMLTSKGAAGVTGSGFVTLAATLAAMPDLNIPLEGLALIIGVDRFLSTGRAVTNLIGNSVATVVLAKVQHKFEPPDSVRVR
jgi:aerobic C4-dicarboxylate transport protein